MTGIEIDFVVTDCLLALELYEKLFDVERIEVTNLERGQNEAVFTVYGVRFHMLDENPQFHLIAPKPGAQQSMWFNVLVPDIAGTYGAAMQAGCTQVQPVSEMPEMGASNAIFLDPFGYVWMLHQIHREVSFEDRLKWMTENA